VTEPRVGVKADGAGSPMRAMADASAPMVAQIVSNQGDCWHADFDAVDVKSKSLRAKIQ
jgi:hypothetical protein